MDTALIARDHGIVGRSRALRSLGACVRAERNVLLEGPVGVGKTRLARAIAGGTGRPFVRVDGDGRYTEAKLVGHFDPPGVLERGYQPDLFVPGPLVSAMQTGSILFINELNRMPEGVQNVLLPALDEGLVHVPHLGEVRAGPGFLVIATQNPQEFVATGHLAEALLDRFELVRLGWQAEDEEVAIVRAEVRCAPSDEIVQESVALVRATREDRAFRRGASVRAAIAIADLAAELGGDVAAAAELALPTRVELAEGEGRDITKVLEDLQKKTLRMPSSPPRR